MQMHQRAGGYDRPIHIYIYIYIINIIIIIIFISIIINLLSGANILTINAFALKIVLVSLSAIFPWLSKSRPRVSTTDFLKCNL